MTGTRRDALRLAWRRRPLFAAGRCARSNSRVSFPASSTLRFPVAWPCWRWAMAAAPEVTFLERRALVVREEGRQWIAVVGIPLSVKAGEQRVSIDDAKGARELAFTVRPKEYAAQRITLKNPRQVNPSDEDMKRIEREMAEQSAANRSYRAGVTPSNLILTVRCRVAACRALHLRRIFNGEERNPHSGLDFASLPARRSSAGRWRGDAGGRLFLQWQDRVPGPRPGMVSMFCHMSAIDVKVGTRCRAAGGGQGGRHGPRHGPHLHWNVSLNDARVDPAIFIGAFKP